MVSVQHPQGRPNASSAERSPLVRPDEGDARSREVDGPGGRLRVYLALPAGSGPWPGVVIVPAPAARRRQRAQQIQQARQLADRGFLAVLPDPDSDPATGPGAGSFRPTGPLGRGWPRHLAGRLVGRRRRQAGDPFDQVEAARAWLASQSACTGAVSVVGLR